MTRQTKNFDLKFQDLQNLILKCLNIVSYMGNKLFNDRLENGQQKLKTIFLKLMKVVVTQPYFWRNSIKIKITLRRRKLFLNKIRITWIFVFTGRPFKITFGGWATQGK